MILAYIYPTHKLVSHDFIDSRDALMLQVGVRRISTSSGPGGVAMNRNKLARWFLDESFDDWLLWVDADMVFGVEQMEALLQTSEPFVAAHATRVSEDGIPAPAAVQRIGGSGAFAPLELDGSSLQPTAGVGMAFTLIHRTVYEATEVRTGHPHIQRMIDGFIVGEDVGMSQYAIDAGFTPMLAADVHVGHIKPHTYWPEG